MPLRPFTAKDFIFTDDDIERAIKEFEGLASGPRPFETFNPIALICAICQEEMASIYGHRCATIVFCAKCGDAHPLHLRECC